MKLYRIRRKTDGKFYGGLAYPWIEAGHEVWNDNGAMYRNIETIANWLYVLCSDWKNANWNPNHCRQWAAKKLKPIVDHYDPEKLHQYEVVVVDVTVKDEEVVEAVDIIGEDDGI